MFVDDDSKENKVSPTAANTLLTSEFIDSAKSATGESGHGKYGA